MKLQLTLLLACVLLSPRVLVAQSTAFTYQGRLQADGTPANGLYELSFSLHDAVTNGNLVGLPITLAPVPVSNGLFLARLDFGAAAFTGANRWLEISVTVFGTDQPVVTLVPRQPITPTPQALHARTAQDLASFGNAPIEIKVNGQRALRLESTSDLGYGVAPNFIGGGPGNFVSPTIAGGTVGGGNSNQVSGNVATVSGGFANRASAEWATVGGGEHNVSSNYNTTVAGGGSNVAGGAGATVGGGHNNRATGAASTISGGENHEVSGVLSTVSGGGQHSASGDLAVIAGGFANTVSATYGAIGGGYNNTNSAIFAVIGGGQNNLSTGENSVIGGGMENLCSGEFATLAGGRVNVSSSRWATVSGGSNNRSIEELATVAGGRDNFASGIASTISGGDGNQASGQSATVGGGLGNTADGYLSFVGGGYGNQSSSDYAVVPGGLFNQATGISSFASGQYALAQHDGAFVWADFSEREFASSASNEFAVRATGGVRMVSAIELDGTPSAGVSIASGSGTWSSLSDRHAKANFTPANPREVLEKVVALPMTSWNYKTQEKSVRHLGPMAQDFHAAFGLGENDRTITTVDADGVALAAIQGLNAKLEDQVKARDARIGELERRLASLEHLLGKLAAKP